MKLVTSIPLLQPHDLVSTHFGPKLPLSQACYLSEVQRALQPPFPLGRAALRAAAGPASEPISRRGSLPVDLHMDILGLWWPELCTVLCTDSRALFSVAAVPGSPVIAAGGRGEHTSYSAGGRGEHTCGVHGPHGDHTCGGARLHCGVHGPRGKHTCRLHGPHSEHTCGGAWPLDTRQPYVWIPTFSLIISD